MIKEYQDECFIEDVPNDYHEPVTEDNVARALNLLFIYPVYKDAYEKCVAFLKPLDEELPIIEKVVSDWCKNG